MPTTQKEQLISLAKDLVVAAGRYERIAAVTPEAERPAVTFRARIMSTMAEALQMAVLSDSEFEEMVQRRYPESDGKT